MKQYLYAYAIFLYDKHEDILVYNNDLKKKKNTSVQVFQLRSFPIWSLMLYVAFLSATKEKLFKVLLIVLSYFIELLTLVNIFIDLFFRQRLTFFSFFLTS